MAIGHQDLSLGCETPNIRKVIFGMKKKICKKENCDTKQMTQLVHDLTLTLVPTLDS